MPRKRNKKLFPLSIGPRTKNQKKKLVDTFHEILSCLIRVHYNSHINWVVFSSPNKSSPKQPSEALCCSFFHLATSPLGLLFLLLGNFFRCLFFGSKRHKACSFISKRDKLNNISHKMSEINNTQHLKNVDASSFSFPFSLAPASKVFVQQNNGRHSLLFEPCLSRSQLVPC